MKSSQVIHVQGGGLVGGVEAGEPGAGGLAQLGAQAQVRFPHPHPQLETGIGGVTPVHGGGGGAGICPGRKPVPGARTGFAQVTPEAVKNT